MCYDWYNKWWAYILVNPTVGSIIFLITSGSIAGAVLCWIVICFLNYIIFSIKDLYEQIEGLKK